MILSTLIATLLSLTTPVSIAAEAGRFTCHQGVDSAVYQLSRKDKDTFEYRVYFPYGVQSASVFSGDVVVSDIARLQKKVDVLKTLGQVYSGQFKASQCIRKSGEGGLFYIHCFTNVPTQINGQTFPRGLSFHASGKQVTTLNCVDGVCSPITENQYDLGIEVGVPVSYGIDLYNFARTYGDGDCVSNKEFWEN